MGNYKLPPDPQHATLKRIYPWDEYDITLVMQWLFAQAAKTGFTGTYEDFKQRYGAYIEAADPKDIYSLIDNYSGTYHIMPLVGIQQVLQTKNKVLNDDIIIDAIPKQVVPVGDYEPYDGQYRIYPMARFQQILRTENKVLEQNIVIDQIPYAEVSNNAGGITVTIG